MKQYLKAFILLLLLFVQTTFGVEVRPLTPPKVAPCHAGKKIVCYRPMRSETPNFSVEHLGEKTIVHNYGHGGGGWSIGPGSVRYCCSLLLEAESDLDRSSPVAVVGCGCIALFTAYELWNRGFTNITIYADQFDDLTSHHAGGLLSFRAVDGNGHLNKCLLQCGLNTYAFFKEIALGQHKDFRLGASIIPTYFETLEDSELEDLVGRGMLPAKEVLVDFGNGVQREMIAYDDSIFIDTGSMMNQLHTYLNAKVTFRQFHLNKFSQLDERIVFNCTGLGSAELNQDQTLYPILGHLLTLRDQSPKELQYMLIVNWEETEENGATVLRTLDFFPKRLSGAHPNDIGVLGGTFFQGACSDEQNEREFAGLLNRATQFFYGKDES